MFNDGLSPIVRTVLSAERLAVGNIPGDVVNCQWRVRSFGIVANLLIRFLTFQP